MPEMDYEELTAAIIDAPITQLPAILRTCITACVQRGVFQAGKLSGFCVKCEKAAHANADVERAQKQIDDPTNETQG